MAETFFFEDDGRTPNNRWPVVRHRVLDAARAPDPAAAFERLMEANDWPAQWRGGVFDYHHYHSNAHEVLAVASGQAQVMLGGEAGQSFALRAGDVLVLPAGTGHCRLEASRDFVVVGGYPRNRPHRDLCRSGEANIDAARRRIAEVPKPSSDPVTGAAGGLLAAWPQR